MLAESEVLAQHAGHYKGTMPTSPPRCDGCLRLTQKVSVLEGRISVLYSIQEDERFLNSLCEASKILRDDLGDSVIPEKPAPEEPAPGDADPTPSAPPPVGADSPDPEVFLGRVAGTSAMMELDKAVPWVQPEERWTREGAKSKQLLTSSTPDPWSLAGRGHPRGKLIPQVYQYAPPVLTANPFSVLDDDFPSLTTVVAQSSSKSGERRHLLKLAVKKHSGRPLPPVSTEVSQPAPSRPPGPPRPYLASKLSPSPPATIIIGDSTVRYVSVNNAHTVVFPGATVAVITEKIQEVMTSFPAADSLIVHAGTNDVRKQQSELLKRDFIQLFGVLKHLHYSVSISGPTPSPGHGPGRFSRLLSLNSWLQSACRTHNVNFINNFDLFWQRNNLFAVDGLHLNFAGARALSSNFSYCIHHCTPPSTGVSQQADIKTVTCVSQQTQTVALPAHALPSADRSLNL